MATSADAAPPREMLLVHSTSLIGSQSSSGIDTGALMRESSDIARHAAGEGRLEKLLAGEMSLLRQEMYHNFESVSKMLQHLLDMQFRKKKDPDRGSVKDKAANAKKSRVMTPPGGIIHEPRQPKLFMKQLIKRENSASSMSIPEDKVLEQSDGQDGLDELLLEGSLGEQGRGQPSAFLPDGASDRGRVESKSSGACSAQPDCEGFRTGQPCVQHAAVSSLRSFQEQTLFGTAQVPHAFSDNDGHQPGRPADPRAVLSEGGRGSSSEFRSSLVHRAGHQRRPVEDAAAQAPPTRQAWGALQNAPRTNTPFSAAGMVSIRGGASREAAVNDQLFSRAGIVVQPFSRDNSQSQSPKASPVASDIIASVLPDSEGLINSGFRQHGRLLAQHDDNGLLADAEAEQRMCRRGSTAPAGRIGHKATSALDAQGEQVVAGLQAPEEYQVIGKEILWNDEEEVVPENSTCWQLWLHTLKTQLLARVGTHAYVVPIRCGGLSPWFPEHLFASQLFTAFLCLTACWAALHPLMILAHAVAEGRDHPVLLSETVQAVGAALSLSLFTGCSFNGWALAATSQRLSFLARRAGFLNDLARSTCTSASLLVGLFLLAVSLRLFLLLKGLHIFGLSCSMIGFGSFAVSSMLLFAQALFLHRLAAALAGTVDLFAEQMVLGETVSWGREQWKLTMALVSDANNKLHNGLLVLLLTLVLFVFCAVYEGFIHQRNVDLVPGCIVAFAAMTVFSRLSTVAAQCESIPPMLGRLLVEDERHDAQLTRLMARIRDSNAGIQILGVRVSPALVSKGVYSVGGVAMFLVLNFKAELRSLHV